jgi:hypothetical protein
MYFRYLRQFCILAAGILLTTIPAHSQTPPEGANWKHVQALPPNTRIDIKAQGRHESCSLVGVDDESLQCTRKPGSSSVDTFLKGEIKSIKLPKRGRSALIGAAVGGTALGVAGFVSTTSSSDGFFGPNFLRGPTTAVGALGGALIGGSIGALTDFSKSTVYKVP